MLADPVSGLVGHTKLALQFLAAHAVARRAEQIHGVIPRDERGARVLKDGASGRVHMMAARGANVGAALLQLVERAFDRTALGAVKAGAPETNLHDVFKAGVFGIEALEKLANAKVGAG